MIVLWLAVLSLAFANGANDNPKGVATLRGSRLAGYSVTILWGTAWTFAGALLSIQIGKGLVALFNGQAFLPVDATGHPHLLFTIPLAASVTVLIASKIGAPVSTTHALAGAFVGTGAAALGMGQLPLSVLGKKIFLPLLLSPLISLMLTLLVFPLLAPLRRLADRCVCLVRREPVLVFEETSSRTVTAQPVNLAIGTASECQRMNVTAQLAPLNLLHWLSAGLMSFSRGLNDSPKIAALLLGTGHETEPSWAAFGVAFAMALGGMLAAQRVSFTLSEQITPLDPTQGFSANLITSSLVSIASRLGLPVSTTHVACGSLFGIGLLNKKETDWPLISQILLAWGITLPAAALIGASLTFLLMIF